MSRLCITFEKKKKTLHVAYLKRTPKFFTQKQNISKKIKFLNNKNEFISLNVFNT